MRLSLLYNTDKHWFEEFLVCCSLVILISRRGRDEVNFGWKDAELQKAMVRSWMIVIINCPVVYLFQEAWCGKCKVES